MALAFTNMMSVAELPRNTFPKALNGLPAVTLTAALDVTGDEKAVLAMMLKVLVEVLPTTTLPSALSTLPAVMLTGALAVIAAAKLAAALTVKD